MSRPYDIVAEKEGIAQIVRENLTKAEAESEAERLRLRFKAMSFSVRPHRQGK
jgi:hypothetical protein